jgi:hypothetical protein
MSAKNEEITRRRIVEFLTMKGGKLDNAGNMERVELLLAKRIAGRGVSHANVLHQVDVLEREGVLRLEIYHTPDGKDIIKCIELIKTNQLALWGETEGETVTTPVETAELNGAGEEEVEIDYRKLADEMLLACFAAIESGDDKAELVALQQQNAKFAEMVVVAEQRLAESQQTVIEGRSVLDKLRSTVESLTARLSAALEERRAAEAKLAEVEALGMDLSGRLNGRSRDVLRDAARRSLRP